MVASQGAGEQRGPPRHSGLCELRLGAGRSRAPGCHSKGHRETRQRVCCVRAGGGVRRRVPGKGSGPGDVERAGHGGAGQRAGAGGRYGGDSGVQGAVWQERTAQETTGWPGKLSVCGETAGVQGLAGDEVPQHLPSDHGGSEQRPGDMLGVISRSRPERAGERP